MKPLFLALLISALGLALSAAPSSGQVGTTGNGPPSAGTPVTATYTIPIDFDPDSVTFRTTGQTFTITNTQQLITGQLLEPSSILGGGGGLNIFAAVPAPPAVGGTIPIVEVDFFTTYTGPLTLTSLSGNPDFVPWFAEMLNPPTGQGFRFFKTMSTQANINTEYPGLDPTEYAFFTLTPDNPNDTAFLTSTFSITGFTAVPEPGTIALLGALAVSGSVAWRRRRTV